MECRNGGYCVEGQPKDSGTCECNLNLWTGDRCETCKSTFIK